MPWLSRPTGLETPARDSGAVYMMPAIVPHVLVTTTSNIPVTTVLHGEVFPSVELELEQAVQELLPSLHPIRHRPPRGWRLSTLPRDFVVARMNVSKSTVMVENARKQPLKGWCLLGSVKRVLDANATKNNLRTTVKKVVRKGVESVLTNGKQVKVESILDGAVLVNGLGSATVATASKGVSTKKGSVREPVADVK